jgi:hypothetical protein
MLKVVYLLYRYTIFFVLLQSENRNGVLGFSSFQGFLRKRIFEYKIFLEV